MSEEGASEVSRHIAKALQLKEAGNEHFKKGNYRDAMVAYHEIYMWVNGFSEGSTGGGRMPGSTTRPVSAEDMKTIKELKVVHHSNLAMCHLKLGNMEKARDNCTKALMIDPNNVKCLFRRGKCYSQLGALDEAKADLTQVLAQQPDNRDAIREMQTLRSRLASHKKKEQKKFAGFFEKLNADEADGPQAAASANSHASAADAASATGVDATSKSQTQGTANPDLAAECQEYDIGEALGPAQAFEPMDATLTS